MKRVLTKSDEQFIRKNYLLLSSRKIGEKLGHPRGTISSFLKREGLKIPKSLAKKWRMETRQALYDSIVHPEDELIKELYLLLPIKTLADLLGRHDVFIRDRMKKLNLVVPPNLVEQRKMESRIKPGAVPPNKGMKQREFMSAEAIERTKATRFKKGQRIYNETFDGAFAIRWSHPERGGQPHWYIRLSKGIWQELQIFEWERVNGPVPPKHVLACIDGDTLNIDSSNWQPLPMKENMLRNSASLRLIDSYVAQTIVGSNRNKCDQSGELLEEILKDKGLIELKRQSLLLKRTINEQQKLLENA